MDLDDAFKQIPGSLPPNHPLQLIKRYTTSSNDCTPVDMYNIALLQNIQYPINYFRTMMHLLLFKFSAPEKIMFRYPYFHLTGHLIQHAHPCNLDKNARFALHIDANCQARILESINAAGYPFYTSWIKQSNIRIPEYPNDPIADLWYYASPNINPWIKTINLDTLAPMTLESIASNPWITPETAHRLLHYAYKSTKQQYAFFSYLLRNESIPISFFESHADQDDHVHLLWRSDYPPEKSRLYSTRFVALPNSPADFLVTRLNDTRDRRVKLYLFTHHNMPETVVWKKFKRMTDKHLKRNVLKSHLFDPFTLLTLQSEFPEEVQLNLLAQRYNEWYKPVVAWLVKTAQSPETFFIRDTTDLNQLIETLTAYTPPDGRTHS